MNTVSPGNVLVLVSYSVASVTLGVVVTYPVQIREDEGGINSEFVGVGYFRVSWNPVAQCPIVCPIALDREGLSASQEVLCRMSEGEVGTETVIGTVGDVCIRHEVVGAHNGIAQGFHEVVALPLSSGTHTDTRLGEFAFQDVLIIAL